MLIAHMRPPALERRLAEKAVLFGVQIVVFDVGVNVVVIHVPRAPIVRIDAQRQRHQPPHQAIGPGRAQEGVMRSIVIDVDVEQHAHGHEQEIAEEKRPGLMLHQAQGIKPDAQRQQQRGLGQPRGIGIAMIARQAGVCRALEIAVKRLLAIGGETQRR